MKKSKPQTVPDWLRENARFGAPKLAAALGVCTGRIAQIAANEGISLAALKAKAGIARNQVAPGEPPPPPPPPPREPPPIKRPRMASETRAGATERFDIHKSDKAVTADFILQTPQGKALALAEALQNPKFKAAIESSQIDLGHFEIVRFKANSWDVTLKVEHKPVTRTNHQFWVEWKRISALPLALALERLVERVKPAPAVKPPKPTGGDRMVEVALYDMHFGLLAWHAETGEDYDVSIAAELLADATCQILARTRALAPEYFLIPIGNDLFHVNDPTNVTPQNQNRLDVDTRLARLIETVEHALEAMTEAFARVAPVKLLWVPGNHDPQTSYWLLRVLAARYRDDKRVDVDTSPKPRKIHLYGRNLIGFMHGCDIAFGKEKALAGLLADEAADVWAPDQYREIHRGHTHKKNELWFWGAETYGSVVVRTIPSLVGTDYWHFSKGFTGGPKLAQYFVWNKSYGLESVNDVQAAREFYHKEKG